MSRQVACKTCGVEVYTMQTRKQPNGDHICTTCLGIRPGDNSPKTAGLKKKKR